MTAPPWARIQKYTSNGAPSGANAMLYMPKVLRAPWARKNRLGRCVLAYVYIPICLIVLKYTRRFFETIVKAPAFLKPIVKAYTR